MTTKRAVLYALVLTLLVPALETGCGGAETPGVMGAPADATSGGPARLESEPAPPLQAQDVELESSVDAEPVLILDATVGAPVRGRLLYYDLWTYVDVCVREIVAATPERPAQVRYTMRLCTEDGRTEAVARSWSKETGPKTLFTDSIYETDRGGTSHLYFECPYGTAWEVDATAESVEGATVRLAIRGQFLACTK